jgi:hypothetical protein
MIIQSPCTEWPGEIELHDPMTLAIEAAWEDALADYEQAKSRGSQTLALLPGLLACVKEWRLENFPAHPTPETFPVRPRAARSELLAAVINGVSKLYEDGQEVPNG